MSEQTAKVAIRWTLEVQKFRACPRHTEQGGEPFDAACPDCVITEPPVAAHVEPGRWRNLDPRALYRRSG